MKSMTLRLDSELAEQLGIVASVEQKPVVEVVRQAIDRFLAARVPAEVPADEGTHGIIVEVVRNARLTHPYDPNAEAEFAAKCLSAWFTTELQKARADAWLEVADRLGKHGPVPNYELNHDGTTDPIRAAYVEGQFDAWALVNSVAIDLRSQEPPTGQEQP